MLRLRSAAVHDLPGAYRVCLLTGDAGQDASARYRDPDLLGHVYVGPYIVGQPAHAFVLDDAEGIAGYCLAALDSRAFEAWAEHAWWPDLRRTYGLPIAGDAEPAGDDPIADPGDRGAQPGSPDAEPGSAGTDAADAALIRLIHRPALVHPAIVAAYPSQLHIDLLTRARGLGFGRRMVEVQLESLRDAGSPGVHLEADATNGNAIDFYGHLGFEAIKRGRDSILMGRRLVHT